MKRFGGIYDKLFTEDRLFDAYYTARTGKRKKRSVLSFEKDLGWNIYNLSRELKTGEYQITPYKMFIIREPKERIIYAPAFRDVIVQHDIYRSIYPIFNQTFIDHSFACRRMYGTHKAAWAAYKKLCCKQEFYYLKMDIRKFFYSIDREILKTLFLRKIKDRKLIDIMCRFSVFSDPVGIPIGNLLSQLYALIYLNPLDHFIKRELKIKNYVRYADDFIVFGMTASECRKALGAITDFLSSELKLSLSKFSIRRHSDGLNFVGYRMWPGYRLIRKRSLGNFNKSIRTGNVKSMVSIMGHAKRTHTLKYMLQSAASCNLLEALPKSYANIARRM